MTDAFINSPVDLAGRLRISTFGPYVVQPRLRPGAARGRHQGHLLRRAGAAAERDGKYGATYVLSSGGVLECDDGEPTDFASSDRFETVYDEDGVSVWRLRARDRAGAWGSRGRRPKADQPFGSTTIVTSGVMPAKTLTATLYVPSDLSGSSRSILWRSTSMPRRASASAMSFDVIEP